MDVALLPEQYKGQAAKMARGAVVARLPKPYAPGTGGKEFRWTAAT